MKNPKNSEKLKNQKFIPYGKLSKKARRELDQKKRSGWGDLRPATRIEKDPKAYRRQEKHRINFTELD
ncbi:MAG: hypothetical protein K2G25_05210 [Oscillospiraceae bacterium]|nr:hypothetical protein [Oscillospiraceae bacterium]